MKTLPGGCFKFLLLGLVSIILVGLLGACGDANPTSGGVSGAVIVPVPTTEAVKAQLSPTAQPSPTGSGAQPSPTSTSAPTVIAPVTFTSVPATATPADTAQPEPTATAIPATATPKPQPTATTKPGSGYPGKIVYDTTDREIFIINPDGSGKKKLANGFSPLFSPDGSRVAFLQRVQSHSEFGKVVISSVKLDGSDRQDYCTSDGNAVIKLIRWSPRSRFIAMTATQNVLGAIYLCNLAEKKLTPEVKTSQGAVSLVYDWTPDGENALWQASSDYLDQALYYGDPDKAGAEAVRLPFSPIYRFDTSGFKFFPVARFSPDGKTIAVGGGGLFFASIPGQQSPLDGQKYVGGEVHNLAWSPDGRALALISQGLPTDQAPLTLHIQPIGKNGATGPTVEISEKLAGGLDWSRQ